mmetsp:Transcript_30385/g.58413  ORF Transcript_30385/g.58413 Transcript_30385/m.58413 type:complete len:881 (+) Transcript_30385:714-3356(+)|eukprot:CAMPEP_0114282128 /NCGR_PEP_ID=MMETSP0059-20121206/3389_1 /TAXON_ID=36894 /ORGANISM="Pyramimonas parkeae, Strain CCMP726" /LENGTH=880 /DNA_ID=CAMNT_0001402741 /DNA_START=621 /DNA_END=3263 /DNA_ORIENTATION=-
MNFFFRRPQLEALRANPGTGIEPRHQGSGRTPLQESAPNTQTGGTLSSTSGRPCFDAALMGKRLLGTSTSIPRHNEDDVENKEPQGACDVALEDARIPPTPVTIPRVLSGSGDVTPRVGTHALADTPAPQPPQREHSSVLDMRRELQSLRRELGMVKEDVRVTILSMPQMAGQMMLPLEALAEQLIEQHRALQSRFGAESQQRRALYNKVMEFQGNIRVFCRCRPKLPREIAKGCEVAMEFDGHNHMELTHTAAGHKRRFHFDRVYTEQASQAEVFEDCAPVVTSLLDGFNVCILAYGQTGTGKTHTIWGEERPEEARGVNYRTISELFQVAEQRGAETEYSFLVSMLEVYNDQLRDLMVPDRRLKLEVRQAREPEGGVDIHGLEEVGPITGGMEQVMDLFRQGVSNRATAQTAMNTDSSRSHSLLRIRVRSRNKLTGELGSAKLWLVDLAGSERLSRSEATGERLKEAQHINKSLSALGDCIAALAQRTSHVPYRNSKLTQVLQDSLGGDAKTLMYIQVSPTEDDAGETLCTLNFGNRVKGVVLGTQRGKEHWQSARSKLEVVNAKSATNEAREVVTKLQSENHRLEQVVARMETEAEKVQALIRQLRKEMETERSHRAAEDARRSQEKADLERLVSEQARQIVRLEEQRSDPPCTPMEESVPGSECSAGEADGEERHPNNGMGLRLPQWASLRRKSALESSISTKIPDTRTSNNDRPMDDLTRPGTSIPKPHFDKPLRAPAAAKTGRLSLDLSQKVSDDKTGETPTKRKDARKTSATFAESNPKRPKPEGLRAFVLQHVPRKKSPASTSSNDSNTKTKRSWTCQDREPKSTAIDSKSPRSHIPFNHNVRSKKAPDVGIAREREEPGGWNNNWNSKRYS